MQHSKIKEYNKVGKRKQLLEKTKKQFAKTGLTIEVLRQKVESAVDNPRQVTDPDLLKMNKELLNDNINLLQELEIAENKIKLLKKEIAEKNSALKTIENAVSILSLPVS